MYPQLRVVCTGMPTHGRPRGQFGLSKKRARVQRHLLESGVLSTRVVLNYFGEERFKSRRFGQTGGGGSL